MIPSLRFPWLLKFRAWGLVLLLGVASPAAHAQYVPGRTYFGQNNYVEYRAGNAPLLLAAPHDGTLRPATLPDRTCPNATTVTDANTQALVRALDSAFTRRYACRAHMVISHLARVKLDPNRSLPEAGCGNAAAGQAWREYHGFLDTAAAQVGAVAGRRGLFLDLHGHGHAIARVELGYLLTGSELRRPDAQLLALADSTSIWGLVAAQPGGPAALPGLLRGPNALGTLLASRGYPALPSQQDPAPQSPDPYFSGGYSTFRHGSYRNAGPVDAIQAETHSPGLRNSAANRRRFADTLAVVLGTYLRIHYGWRPCRVLPTGVARPAPTTTCAVQVQTGAAGHELVLAPGCGATRLLLYDLRGALRFQRALPGNGQLLLPPLAPGLYVVRLQWPRQAPSRAIKIVLP